MILCVTITGEKRVNKMSLKAKIIGGISVIAAIGAITILIIILTNGNNKTSYFNLIRRYFLFGTNAR